MKMFSLRKIICGALLLAAMANVASAESLLTQKGYQLEQVVVFSRHNIRSPLTGAGSFSTQVTPNEWFQWTAPRGHLSVHGAMAETAMGIYFRKYLEDESFMPADWVPAFGQVRFYANSYQRTIATAQYFSSGMLPIANVRIERHVDLDTKDPVFLPTYNKSDKLAQLAGQDLSEMFNGLGLDGAMQEVAKYISSEEKILNFKASPYAKENHREHFDISPLQLVFNKNNALPLAFKGQAAAAVGVCDTLIMQYYEIPDDVQAAWGNTAVTHEDWQNVGRILTLSGILVWGNYHNALVQSRNTIKELRSELTRENRKFTFLCGHDTNIACILSALQALPYELPDTITPKTPIGGKIVMEKRLGPDGAEYISLNLVYATDKQLRNIEQLSLDNPPAKYPLRFQGLEPNEDGLYLYEDFLQLLDDTIAAAAEFDE